MQPHTIRNVEHAVMLNAEGLDTGYGLSLWRFLLSEMQRDPEPRQTPLPFHIVDGHVYYDDDGAEARREEGPPVYVDDDDGDDEFTGFGEDLYLLPDRIDDARPPFPTQGEWSERINRGWVAFTPENCFRSIIP